jgi:hypothetical protein
MEELNTFIGAPAGTTYPGYILTLAEVFKTAVRNPEFIKDVKKSEKATVTLTLVDPETRVRAQLETNAYKTLRAKAAKVAEETGTYIAPTLPEVTAYIEAGVKVWRDKQ